MKQVRSAAVFALASLTAACAADSDFKPPYDDSVRTEAPASHERGDAGGVIPPQARERRRTGEDPRAAIEARLAGERTRGVQQRNAGKPPHRDVTRRSRVEAEIAHERRRRNEAFGLQTPGERRRLEMRGGPELDVIAPAKTSTAARESSTRGPTARPERLPARESVTRREPAGVAEGAPPLPQDARPGQCFMLVKRPAEYRTVSREVAQPPRYRTVEERVLEEPAGEEWRDDCGPLEKVSGETGETACLVRTPARYRTVTRRVQEPGGTRVVRERERVRGPRYEWREILCRASLTPSLIRDLQRTLDREGYNPGPVDGVFGPKTRSAVNAYQRDHGLPVDDKLNMATLRHLDVMPR